MPTHFTPKIALKSHTCSWSLSARCVKIFIFSDNSGSILTIICMLSIILDGHLGGNIGCTLILPNDPLDDSIDAGATSLGSSGLVDGARSRIVTFARLVAVKSKSPPSLSSLLVLIAGGCIRPESVCDIRTAFSPLLVRSNSVT